MYTYFFLSNETGSIKIGRSKNVAERLQQVSRDMNEVLEFLGAVNGDRESEFHARFSSHRIPRTEWFGLDSPGVNELLAESEFLSIGLIPMERRSKCLLETTGEIASRVREVAKSLNRTQKQVTTAILAASLDMLDDDELRLNDPNTAERLEVGNQIGDSKKNKEEDAK